LLNVLAVIKGHAQLLQRRLRGSDHPQAERLVTGLEQIDASTGRMTDLVVTLRRNQSPRSPADPPGPPPNDDLTAER
jgi:hypothetical protein